MRPTKLFGLKVPDTIAPSRAASRRVVERQVIDDGEPPASDINNNF